MLDYYPRGGPCWNLFFQAMRGRAWWEGLVELCAGFGLQVRYLGQGAIEGLTRWVLNPDLNLRQPIGQP